MVKQKKKNVPSNLNMVVNPFRVIGKRIKMYDPKLKESVSTMGLRIIRKGTVKTTWSKNELRCNRITSY